MRELSRRKPPLRDPRQTALLKNLCVRNIPRELNRIATLSSHFENFGQVVNVQSHPEKNQVRTTNVTCTAEHFFLALRLYNQLHRVHRCFFGESLHAGYVMRGST